ncbi:MAG: DUF3597 domain-containing protein [Janthinobacterium lividum]
MSMFGNIVSALFHHASAAAPTQTASADTPASSGTSSDPTPAGSAAATPAASGAPTTSASASSAASGSASQTVDAKAVLEGLAAKNPQKLDWQNSIVDMMKLLDLDSSLASRKQLAEELHYTGNTDDSAAMNVWLHGQVMQKLSANGGKVPADLKA